MNTTFCLVLLVAITGCTKQKVQENWRRNKAYDAKGRLIYYPPPAEPPTPPQPAVAASIKAGELTLQIRNENDFDWPSTTVHLNGTIFGFEYKAGPLAKGSATSIELREFTRSNGERFQPSRYKPKEVVVVVPGCASPVYEF